MPTIQSLVTAQLQTSSSQEFSGDSREQLEARLETLSRRLRLHTATERAARIGHYEWNRDLDCLESCSEEYALLFDMTVEQTLESHSSLEKTLELIHPDDRNQYLKATAVMHESKALEVDFRIMLKDGTVRYMREYAVTIIDEGGVDRGSYGLLQDISRQIRYERDLEYRDELACQTEELTDIGHFIFDEEFGRYIYLSEGFARIQGKTVEECMEDVKSFDDDLGNIVAEDRERVARTYRQYIEDGENCVIEYRIERADGEIRWLQELGRAKLMKDGRVSQTLGVVQDITNRVEREQELLFKDAMASQAETIADIGYFMLDTVSKQHLFVSQGRARIIGLGAEEFQTRVRSIEDYLEFVHKLDRDRIRQLYQQQLDNGAGWEAEYRVQRTNGEVRWVREVGKAPERDGNLAEHIIGVMQDVTEQKKTEQELRYKDALANQAEAITDIGHFVYDEIRQQYLYVSPGLARIHGKNIDDLGESGLKQVGGMGSVHPDDHEAVNKVYDRFLTEGDEWQVEYRLMRADGEIRWVREMGKVHLVTHGIPEQTIGVIQDISTQKQVEQEVTEARDSLEQQVVDRTRELVNTVKQLQVEIEEREKIAAELNFLANHDALTGLPSLRLCKDRLDQSLAEARRKRQTSAVMFLDLDGFKDINDRYGHEFGDSVLKSIAGRITTEIRETDTVARIGGDEFVIILSSLPDCAIANRIATSLVERIADPLVIKDVQVAVSASIGISLYPDHGVTAEELIRSADKAMYRIKREGKNNFGLVETG